MTTPIRAALVIDLPEGDVIGRAKIFPALPAIGSTIRFAWRLLEVVAIADAEHQVYTHLMRCRQVGEAGAPCDESQPSLFDPNTEVI